MGTQVRTLPGDHRIVGFAAVAGGRKKKKKKKRERKRTKGAEGVAPPTEIRKTVSAPQRL